MRAIDADKLKKVLEMNFGHTGGAAVLAQLIDAQDTIQPEIIRCRNCKFASGDSRICMQFGHSPIGELDFCAWAERIPDERFD